MSDGDLTDDDIDDALDAAAAAQSHVDPETTVPPEPLIFTPPDLQAATIALTRALPPSLRVRLQCAPTALILIVPSPDWCAPIRVMARHLIGEGTTVDYSSSPRDPWLSGAVNRLYYTRVAADRSNRPDLSGALIPSALSGGGSVIGIAADVSLLPPQLRDAADLTITIDTLTGRDVMKIIHNVTGARRCPPIADALTRSLGPQEINICIRKGTKAAECIDRLTAFAARSTMASQDFAGVPSLDEAVGYGAARDWGRALKRDIDRRRADPKAVSLDTITRSLLLTGPPGVGKTFFAKILAKSCGIPLLVTSYGDFMAAGTGHLGDFIQALRRAFDDARTAAGTENSGGLGAILLIDEVDSFAGRHVFSGDHNALWIAAVGNALLTLAERNSPSRRGVILIGCSNYAEMCDPALRRSGRLSPSISLSVPTAEDLCRILSVHAPELPAKELTPLATLVGGMTGADAARAVEAARQNARDAGRPLVTKDLVNQLLPEEVRPIDHLRRIAMHEAAHAVIGVHLGVMRLDFVSLVNAGDTAAFARFEDIPGVERRRSYYEAAVALKLAGRAMDELTGGATAGAGGAGSDLSDSTMIVAGLHRAFGLGDSLLTLPSTSTIAAMLQYDAKFQAIVEQDLQALYLRTQALVAEYRTAIEAVAEILVKRRVLSGEEVRSIIAKTALGKKTSGSGRKRGGVK